MQQMRDLLADGLRALGMRVLPCHGTYFLVADYSALDRERDDMEFCRYLTMKAKVAAIPVSAFFQQNGGHVPRNLIRFCFCKEKPLLEEALLRLDKFLT
jgi:aspartate/methionine/tyrosine aminotransferase